MTLDN